MTVAVRDTSLETYANLKEVLADSEMKVYETILDNPRSTRKEVSEISGIPINNVCGRTADLIKYGLVKEGEQKKNDCGSVAYQLYAVDSPDLSLLSFKKTQKREIMKLKKKHLPTMMILIDNLKKQLGGELEVLKEHGKEGIYEDLKELEDTNRV
jgi:hypothetical protein